MNRRVKIKHGHNFREYADVINFIHAHWK